MTRFVFRNRESGMFFGGDNNPSVMSPIDAMIFDDELAAKLLSVSIGEQYELCTAEFAVGVVEVYETPMSATE